MLPNPKTGELEAVLESADVAVGELQHCTTLSEPTGGRRTERELCEEVYRPRQCLSSKDSAFLSCATHPGHLGNFPEVGAAESTDTMSETAPVVKMYEPPKFGTAAYGWGIHL